MTLSADSCDAEFHYIKFLLYAEGHFVSVILFSVILFSVILFSVILFSVILFSVILFSVLCLVP
jgi:hypothetical protein